MRQPMTLRQNILTFLSVILQRLMDMIVGQKSKKNKLWHEAVANSIMSEKKMELGRH